MNLIKFLLIISIVLIQNTNLVLCQNETESAKTEEQKAVVSSAEQINNSKIINEEDRDKKIISDQIGTNVEKWFDEFVKNLSPESKNLLANYLYYRKLALDNANETISLKVPKFALRDSAIEQGSIWKIFEKATENLEAYAAINAASKLIRESKDPISMTIALYEKLLNSNLPNSKVEFGFDAGNNLPTSDEISKTLTNRLNSLVQFISNKK